MYAPAHGVSNIQLALCLVVLSVTNVWRSMQHLWAHRSSRHTATPIAGELSEPKDEGIVPWINVVKVAGSRSHGIERNLTECQTSQPLSDPPHIRNASICSTPSEDSLPWRS